MKFLFLIIFSLLIFNSTSCTYQKEHKYRIVFLQCCHDEWRDVMNSEMRRELAFHPDIDLEIIESDFNTSKQIDQIRSLLKQNIDLLIISPNEAQGPSTAVEEIYRAGIPVVLIDRKINSKLYTAFVGADNYEIGKTAGEFIADKFKNQGNIVELKMSMTITPAIERYKGFNFAISQTQNLKIIDTFEDKGNLEGLEDYLRNVLKKHPNVNIVFGQTDVIAMQAFKIIQKIDGSKDIFFVGIDAIPITKGMQQVKEGILDASLLYPTGGAEAIQTAVKILHKQPFEKENKLLTNVITSENVDIMLSQVKKIIGQQLDIERQALRITNLNKTYSSQRNRLYIMSVLFVGVVVLGTFLFFLLQEKQRSNLVLEQQNDAINRQKDEIEKVSEVARQATEDKMRFYSYISHEFKTPLSLILTPTEDLIQRKVYNVNESKQVLELIKKNANRLLKLVDQVLDLRKIDAGKIKLNADFYDLVSFSKDIVDDFKFKAKNANIDLQFICPFKELPYEFDAEKLDKVLFNILSNAFKYTANGGFIHVSLLKNINNVEIKISDNGVGMSEIDRENAFEMFYRANKNVSLGTGLGLALSKEFVHLHKGEISVESKKDSGTSFVILLPLGIDGSPKQVADSPAFDHETEDEKVKQSEIRLFESDISLVIIEDNTELLNFLNAKFSKLYNVYLAENAEEGWNKILSFVPDLIISDVMLPKQDGFDLTQKVKQDFRTSHIPVILLTAKGKIESQIEGTKAGADAYIGKPFSQLLLEEKVKNLIENRNRMRRRYSNEVTNPGNVHSKERKFLLDFELLIEKYLNESALSVEKLSAELGMSRVQLYRKITAITNHNVNDYIAEYKIKKAKSLLSDYSKNISEIAYELGFNNPSYFTTFFKHKTNKTPSEWRNT